MEILHSDAEYARRMDEDDPLREFRRKFHIPKHQSSEVIYLCGNSLGLQPKTAAAAVEQELKDWAELGVEGHFKAKNPWFHYHKFLTEPTARLVGALPEEVVVMNNLTVNLHLMMASFYRPEGKRNKILTEAGAFPSDAYAMESQVRWHGLDPAEALLEVAPREGEPTLRTEDIVKTIEREGDSIALVLFGGVQYYTGQLFDMKSIAQAAHRVGAKVGFDLAHAAGNVPLRLHDWGPDFAVWCAYKYLNSGPGGTSGIFVHERHARQADLPRLAGWWGYNEEKRFLMKKGFEPMVGAAGWQLSNAQILPMAVHRASLEIFEEAGMDRLRQKSEMLTGYLEKLLSGIPHVELITPKNPTERGCQLSFKVGIQGKEVFQNLNNFGVVVDWREPGVIRAAPVPLYNTFEDVRRFAAVLQETLR